MMVSRIRPAWALASLTTLMAVLHLTSSASAQPEEDAEAPASADPAEDEAEATDGGADAGSEATGEASAEGSVDVGAALGGETEATAEAETSAETGASGEPAQGEPAMAPAPNGTDYAIGIQRLPGSAYPEPQPRGIKGGSLWFNMHGLQWPYLPMQGGEPSMTVGVSGFAWVDPSYAVNKSTESNQVEETQWRTQSRFGLRISPTYSVDQRFVQGQAELIANSDQTSTRTTDPDTDDLWVRIGQWNKWDVQLGRYEAWEVYHFGMGLDLNTFERDGATGGPEAPPPIYGATYGFYRSGVGNVAAHIYPLDFLRFEMLGKFGSATLNTYGARPAAIVDFGMVKFKVAGEYLRERSFQDENPRYNELRGVGAALQFVLDPYVEAGVNGGYGLTDSIDNRDIVDVEGTFTTYSYGGFANARVIENLIVGAGANYTWKENVQQDMLGRVGEFDHFQGFGAIQYAFFGQFYLKFVGAYAKARMAPTFTQAPPYENTSYSGRIRASVFF